MLFVFILSIFFIAKPVDKSFFHEGLVDKLVFYLSPSVQILSEHLDGGRFRMMFKGTDCAALDTIGNKTANEHYSVRHLKSKNGCGLEIRPKVAGVKVEKPLEFKSINGKKAISVAVQKKKPQKAKDDTLCTRPLVIVDPGHGGEDPGTIGLNGVAEKDFVLKIAKKLRAELASRGVKVALTRKTDVYVPLDKRTSMANKHDCALFISLHANHSAKRDISGVETYYSEMSLLGKPNLSKDIKSEKLAKLIHSQLVGDLKKQHPNVVDRKVRREVSQVLFGTEMPSILLELGFLSNKDEAKRLCSEKYQDLMVKGLANGIDKYLKS